MINEGPITGWIKRPDYHVRHATGYFWVTRAAATSEERLISEAQRKLKGRSGKIYLGLKLIMTVNQGAGRGVSAAHTGAKSGGLGER